MLLRPTEIRIANAVESGTVITTIRKVFLSACRKYGSRSTYE